MQGPVAAIGIGQRLQHPAAKLIGGLGQLHGHPTSARCVARRQRQLQARVASAEAVQQQVQTPGVTQFKFVCPICLNSEFVVHSSPNPYQQCSCQRCARTFDAKSKYLDLTLTSGVQQQVYQQKMWQGTELFRQPLISFVYERGWRQNFANVGFPGPEKEFDMAMSYLAPAQGGILIDASCGTGLFTRLFARSCKFSGVVALDFSESMLQQAQQFFAEDPALLISTPIVAVRADVGRLPFATGSVDAIHAGAAIHCWPNPQAAMAEISRVLKPGGVFVASTFLTPFAPLGELIGDKIVRPLSQNLNPFGANTRTFRYWEEDELKDLVAIVGLTGYTRIRSRMFIMFAATKPMQLEYGESEAS
eukprot:GHRR01017579.1.p1 GENE.GHRR01017579.1~~GHRR01017579.1.p1  ORF type:complete len:362 (+),score=106.91 GHRR01017579.1:669-1754(+)